MARAARGAPAKATSRSTPARLPATVRAHYLGAPEAHRVLMLQLRECILSVVPDAEEVISYGMPAFRVDGTIVAGLLANKTYVGYYPFSGTVLPALPEALASFRQTKSALHVPLDRTLSRPLVRTLIRLRLAQSRPTSRSVRAPGASARHHRR